MAFDPSSAIWGYGFGRGDAEREARGKAKALAIESVSLKDGKVVVRVRNVGSECDFDYFGVYLYECYTKPKEKSLLFGLIKISKSEEVLAGYATNDWIPVNDFREIEISDDDRRIYESVVKAFKRAEYGKYRATDIRALRAQKQQAIMRMMESFAVPAAIETAKAALAKGRSVSVFSQFVSDADLEAVLKRNGVRERDVAKLKKLASPADAVADALEKAGFETVRYYGKYKGNVEDYQKNRKRVFVGSYAKGAVGISLHDETGERPRTQIVLSVPYSAKMLAQVAGRPHRLTSKSGFNGATSFSMWK